MHQFVVSRVVRDVTEVAGSSARPLQCALGSALWRLPTTTFARHRTLVLRIAFRLNKTPGMTSLRWWFLAVLLWTLACMTTSVTINMRDTAGAVLALQVSPPSCGADPCFLYCTRRAANLLKQICI